MLHKIIFMCCSLCFVYWAVTNFSILEVSFLFFLSLNIIFITVFRFTFIISPWFEQPETVTKIMNKWKLEEFQVLNIAMWYTKEEILLPEANNTASFETDKLWFYSSSQISHKQLQAIDVCSRNYCYSTFISGTLGYHLYQK